MASKAGSTPLCTTTTGTPFGGLVISARSRLAPETQTICVAVLTAALVSTTGIGLATAPAQAAPAVTPQSQILLTAQLRVAGAIGAKWKSLGGSKSFLGQPVNNERRLKTGGAYQSFRGGAIHWSPKTGAHPTKGAIQKTWASAGWENGRYGYPTSGEYTTPTATPAATRQQSSPGSVKR